MQGAVGPTGLPGPTGAQGSQGFQGSQGAGLTGAQGAKGAQGATGAQGVTGSQGIQGAQGPAGPPGPSDIRLKKNIQPIKDAINIISKLRGVEFTWIENEILDVSNYVGQKSIGFIAQEVASVLPEVVYGSEEKGFKVKYSDVIALCIEAIKEQSIILDEKEIELSRLESIAKEKGLI